MKERPILFSGEMIRAILDGRKSQTRRVMSIPPVEVFPSDTPNVTIYQMNGEPLKQWFIFPREIDGLIEYLRPGVGKKPSKKQAQRASNWLHSYRRGDVKWSIDEVMGLCPYGVPGDRLWVRETFQRCGCTACATTWPSKGPHGISGYRATYSGPSGAFWRPSIFMPRWASRITLEITEVRVQRVQEISERDAIAEGIDRCESSAAPWAPFLYCDYNLANPDDCAEWFASPIDSFRSLWDSINSKRGNGWEKNDWVWALTFKRVQS